MFYSVNVIQMQQIIATIVVYIYNCGIYIYIYIYSIKFIEIY